MFLAFLTLYTSDVNVYNQMYYYINALLVL